MSKYNEVTKSKFGLKSKQQSMIFTEVTKLQENMSAFQEKVEVV
jgi:hypothetical protein